MADMPCSECGTPTGHLIDLARFPRATVMCGTCSRLRYPPTGIRQDADQPLPIIRPLPAWLETIDIPRDDTQEG